MLEAVEGRRLEHRDLIAHLVDERLDAVFAAWFRVQPHVEQRKLHLPQRLQPALEILGCQHSIEKLARQRLAGVDMRSQTPDHIPFPAEVLHELAWQFNGVPLDTRDAGHADVVDAGQQVMQAVSELMEQRGHVVVAEHCRSARCRWCEVAHQLRHRFLQPAFGARPAAAHIVHPGTGALAGSCIGIEIELAHQLRLAIG